MGVLRDLRYRLRWPHRRGVIALTPAGRRLLDRAMNYRRDRLEQARPLLTEDERADLARCFTRLVEAATEVKMTKGAQG